MAVRPWIGQITEPANHNPVNNAKPDITSTATDALILNRTSTGTRTAKPST